MLSIQSTAKRILLEVTSNAIWDLSEAEKADAKQDVIDIDFSFSGALLLLLLFSASTPASTAPPLLH